MLIFFSKNAWYIFLESLVKCIYQLTWICHCIKATEEIILLHANLLMIIGYSGS